MRILFLLTFLLNFSVYAQDYDELEISESSPLFSLVFTECHSTENTFTHRGLIPDDAHVIPSFALRCFLNKGVSVCQSMGSIEKIYFLLNKNSQSSMNLTNFPQEEIIVNKKNRLSVYTKNVLGDDDIHYSIFCKGIYSSKEHLMALTRVSVSEGLTKILKKDK